MEPVPEQPCPECRDDVPAARWCNRCGARLAGEPLADPGRHAGPRTWLLGAVGLVGIVAAGIATTAVAPSDTAGRVESGVVLDEPPSRPDPSEPTMPRTDVVCSDLRVRSVPTAELETSQRGELVDLAHGACVVMGPEGAAVP